METRWIRESPPVMTKRRLPRRLCAAYVTCAWRVCVHTDEETTFGWNCLPCVTPRQHTHIHTHTHTYTRHANGKLLSSIAAIIGPCKSVEICVLGCYVRGDLQADLQIGKIYRPAFHPLSFASRWSSLVGTRTSDRKSFPPRFLKRQRRRTKRNEFFENVLLRTSSNEPSCRRYFQRISREEVILSAVGLREHKDICRKKLGVTWTDEGKRNQFCWWCILKQSKVWWNLRSRY